jgi:hypothetical protein
MFFKQWLDTRHFFIAPFSPVYFFSSGLHHVLDPAFSVLAFLRPWLALTEPLFPRPVGIWSLLHSPAEGKPEKYRESQGKKATKAYNRVVAKMVKVFSPGEAVEGGVQTIDWFNVTEGGSSRPPFLVARYEILIVDFAAASYDGTHYAYQVSMEKVQIMLNYLDLVWGETNALNGRLSWSHPRNPITFEEEELGNKEETERAGV